MISEKTYGQIFNNDVGMKSTGDDFEGMDVISELHQQSQWQLGIDLSDLIHVRGRPPSYVECSVATTTR